MLVSSLGRYSDALKRSELVWNEKTLDAWLHNPAALMPGNTMLFEGIPDPGSRADLVGIKFVVQDGRRSRRPVDWQAGHCRHRHAGRPRRRCPCTPGGYLGIHSQGVPVTIQKRWFVLAAVAALLGAVPVLRLTRGVQPADSDLVPHARPRELANLRFSDGAGRPTSLAAFRGRVVLLNVWATWCPPCREEMPTLDRLQAMLGWPGFEVVALSIDHGGLPVVRDFFDGTRIKHLQPYLDTFGDAQSNLAVAGVPLTLLIDREGREIGRKLGPATWDNPRMVQLIRSHMAPGTAPSQPARK